MIFAGHYEKAYEEEVRKDGAVYKGKFRRDFVEDDRITPNRNTGAYNGTVLRGAMGPGGRANAARFDGASGYVNCGNDSSLNPGAVTYEAWVKPLATSNAYSAIMERISASAVCGVFLKSNGKLAVYITIGVSTASYDGTGIFTLSIGRWYHVAFTYGLIGGIVGYVNGSVDGTAPYLGAITTNNGTTAIGNDVVNAGRFFNGVIAHPAIYGDALPPARIASHYNTMLGRIRRPRIITPGNSGLLLRRRREVMAA